MEEGEGAWVALASIQLEDMLFREVPNAPHELDNVQGVVQTP